MSKHGTEYIDDRDPASARFLSEGICPFDKTPMYAVETRPRDEAICPKCARVWLSKRVEVIFPHGKRKETA